MKKLLLTFILTIGIYGIGISSTANANTNSEKHFVDIESIKEMNKDLKVQKQLYNKALRGELFDSNNSLKSSLGKSEFIDDFTSVTTYPDGSKSTLSLDFSEATFYDVEGNIIEDFVVPIEPVEPVEGSISVMSADSSGGTWTTGSGYSCVSGLKIEGSKYRIGATFKANFCINEGIYVYDNISRIYEVLPRAHSWDIMQDGIFRPKESSELPALGGVKFSAKANEDSTQTAEYIYLSVGKDSFKLTGTFN